MLPLRCFQNLGPNSCFPPSQSRDCIVETPLNTLLGRICLQTSNDPSTNKSQSQTVLPIPRRVLSPKHIFFNTIKPLLVLTSSPSRTNTNFNTLQCSFPKPILNTAFMSPIPQNPHPSPQICSATIEKALGLRRWPLQGYDRWSGARSARFSGILLVKNFLRKNEGKRNIIQQDPVN